MLWYLARKCEDSPNILLSGFPGQGKSTTEIILIRIIMRLDKIYAPQVYTKFSLKEDIYYIPDRKLVSMITSLSDVVRGWDEGYWTGYNLNTMERQTRELSVKLGTIRNRRNIFFFCFSEIHRATKPIQERALFWIHIPMRGRAILFVRQKVFTTDDPWGLKDILNEKKMGKISYMLWRNENYITSFRTAKLPDTLFAKYDKLKTKAQEKKSKEDSMKQQHEEVDNAILEDVYNKITSGVWTQADILEKLIEVEGMHTVAAKFYEKEYYKFAERRKREEKSA